MKNSYFSVGERKNPLIYEGGCCVSPLIFFFLGDKF